MIQHELDATWKSPPLWGASRSEAARLMGNAGELSAAQSTQVKGRVMPIDFKPGVSSAFDHQSGVSIPQPRMLPVTPPDGPYGVEYQYVFRLDDERIGALGIFGSEVALEVTSASLR